MLVPGFSKPRHASKCAESEETNANIGRATDVETKARSRGRARLGPTGAACTSSIRTALSVSGTGTAEIVGAADLSIGAWIGDRTRGTYTRSGTNLAGDGALR